MLARAEHRIRQQMETPLSGFAAPLCAKWWRLPEVAVRVMSGRTTQPPRFVEVLGLTGRYEPRTSRTWKYLVGEVVTGTITLVIDASDEDAIELTFERTGDIPQAAAQRFAEAVVASFERKFSDELEIDSVRVVPGTPPASEN